MRSESFIQGDTEFPHHSYKPTKVLAPFQSVPFILGDSKTRLLPSQNVLYLDLFKSYRSDADACYCSCGTFGSPCMLTSFPAMVH